MKKENQVAKTDLNEVLSFFDAHSNSSFYKDLKALELPDVLADGTSIMYRFDINPKESSIQLLNEDNVKRFNHHPWHGIILKTSDTNKLVPGSIVLLKRVELTPTKIIVFNEVFLEVVYNLDVWFYYHPDKAIRYLDGIKDKIKYD